MKRVRKILRSFYCAGRGIAFCLRHEKHFRFHLAVTAYVMYFSTFYDFSGTDYAVLILTCSSVIFMELINTAVEVVIDKVSPQYNIFALIGKDLASGAVLFAAAGAVAVGIFMFWDMDVLRSIFYYFASAFYRPLILVLSAAGAVIFVSTAKPRRTGSKRKTDDDSFKLRRKSSKK